LEASPSASALAAWNWHDRIMVGIRTERLEFDDLRGRVIGQPEISTDGFHPFRQIAENTAILLHF
jgi:hypothetical protein